MSDEQTKEIEPTKKPESAVESKAEEKPEAKSLIQRLLCTAQWIRFLFVILFAVILCVSSYLIGLLVLLQFVFALVTGQDNEKLRRLGRGFSTFVFQILQFVTYNSEEKPFPFADWPDAGVKDNDSHKDS